MKKIVLVCAAGMSTSLLMKKMEQYAASINYDVQISAHPVGSVAETGKDADIILLGPQIRYNLSKVKGIFPSKPVEAMDIQAYGSMDGKKIIEHVKTVIGE